MNDLPKVKKYTLEEYVLIPEVQEYFRTTTTVVEKQNKEISGTKAQVMLIWSKLLEMGIYNNHGLDTHTCTTNHRYLSVQQWLDEVRSRKQQN
jgi:hypothetical protein